MRILLYCIFCGQKSVIAVRAKLGVIHNHIVSEFLEIYILGGHADVVVISLCHDFYTAAICKHAL